MMNSEGVDVWKVYPSGIVDMRMSKHLYSSIQGYIRNVCYLSIQDVEAHVRAAEVFMLSDKQKYSVRIDNNYKGSYCNLYVNISQTRFGAIMQIL